MNTSAAVGGPETTESRSFCRRGKPRSGKRCARSRRVRSPLHPLVAHPHSSWPHLHPAGVRGRLLEMALRRPEALPSRAREGIPLNLGEEYGFHESCPCGLLRALHKLRFETTKVIPRASLGVTLTNQGTNSGTLQQSWLPISLHCCKAFIK